MRRVLIASPLRQDINVLTEYLESLSRLHVPSDVYIEKYFVINDSEDKLSEIQELLTDKYPSKFIIVNNTQDYKSDTTDHIWTFENLNNMMDFRNQCLKYALEKDFDYIWFIDTDLVVHPETLNKLLSYRVPLIAEIFWTHTGIGLWFNGSPYCLDHYVDHKLLPELSRSYMKPGCYYVGYTGANFLINMDVVKQGIDYSSIDNIIDKSFTEDRNFCLKALTAGYKILIDTNYPSVHLYNQEKYKSFMENKDKTLEQMNEEPSKIITL